MLLENEVGNAKNMENGNELNSPTPFRSLQLRSTFLVTKINYIP